MASKHAVLIFSAMGLSCGFLTSLFMGHLWSEAFNDEPTTYSLICLFYLTGIAVGQTVSPTVKQRLSALSVPMVLLLCFIAASSIPIVKFGILFWNRALWCPLALSLFCGIASASLLRELSRSKLSHFSATLAVVAIISIAFAIVMPQRLGLAKSLLVLSLISTIATYAVARPLGKFPRLEWMAAAALLLPWPVHFSYLRVSEQIASKNRSVKFVHREQSPLQKIVLTEEINRSVLSGGQKSNVLYLNGYPQFNSLEEQNFNACLVHIPLAVSEFLHSRVERVLVLGGGDGLAIRNLLEVPSIEQILLVEPDRSLIRIASEHPTLRRMNLESLHSNRIQVVNEKPFTWVRRMSTQKDRFDLILVDLPLPRNVSRARNYSAEFYRFLFQLLKPQGVLALQGGPAFEGQRLSRVPTSIENTLRSLQKNATLYASPRDNEAFVIATHDPDFKMESFAEKVGMASLLGTGLLCTYDPKWQRPQTEINTLNHLPIIEYFNHPVGKTKIRPQQFKQARAVFLPD